MAVCITPSNLNDLQQHSFSVAIQKGILKNHEISSLGRLPAYSLILLYEYRRKKPLLLFFAS